NVEVQPLAPPRFRLDALPSANKFRNDGIADVLELVDRETALWFHFLVQFKERVALFGFAFISLIFSGDYDSGFHVPSIVLAAVKESWPWRLRPFLDRNFLC